jgi:hypothetical protein
MARVLWVVIVVAAWLFANSLVSASECPKGATIQGAPPPRGDAYFCAKRGPSGDFVRHGWAVIFDRYTTFKREECEYRGDVRHGRCTLLDAAGERTERGYFEDGKRTREWWFWALPTAEPLGHVRLLAASEANPRQLVERRAILHETLVELGADEPQARGLAQHVLEYIDDANAPRRVVCGDQVCVGPGRGGEPLYVRLKSSPPEAERDRALLTALITRAETTTSTEGKQFEITERKEAVERQRRMKEYRAAVARYPTLVRQWQYTSLRCNDGTRSPSCVCGGSWRGCCSHHGGVNGCPRPEPTPPVPPPGFTDTRE